MSTEDMSNKSQKNELTEKQENENASEPKIGSPEFLKLPIQRQLDMLMEAEAKEHKRKHPEEYVDIEAGEIPF